VSRRRIILDTDVASLSIKNVLPPVLLRELLGAQVGITFLTLGELNRWALLRNWGPRKVAGLEVWLSMRPTLPYNDSSPANGVRSPLTPVDVAGRVRRTTAGSRRA
jgi:toxin FitB